jgi:hypothetical protein
MLRARAPGAIVKCAARVSARSSSRCAPRRSSRSGPSGDGGGDMPVVWTLRPCFGEGWRPGWPLGSGKHQKCIECISLERCTLGVHLVSAFPRSCMRCTRAGPSDHVGADGSDAGGTPRFFERNVKAGPFSHTAVNTQRPLPCPMPSFTAGSLLCVLSLVAAGTLLGAGSRPATTGTPIGRIGVGFQRWWPSIYPPFAPRCASRGHPDHPRNEVLQESPRAHRRRCLSARWR